MDFEKEEDLTAEEEKILSFYLTSPLKMGSGEFVLIKSTQDKFFLRDRLARTFFWIFISLFLSAICGILIAMAVISKDRVFIKILAYALGCSVLIFFPIFMAVMKPIILDFTDRYYWKGWGKPRSSKQKVGKSYFLFSDLDALQLIKSEERENNSSYIFTTYHINGIFKNFSRVFIMRHTDLDMILRDGNLLSEKMGLPLYIQSGIRKDMSSSEKEGNGEKRSL